MKPTLKWKAIGPNLSKQYRSWINLLSSMRVLSCLRLLDQGLCWLISTSVLISWNILRQGVIWSHPKGGSDAPEAPLSASTFLGNLPFSSPWPWFSPLRVPDPGCSHPSSAVALLLSLVPYPLGPGSTPGLVETSTVPTFLIPKSAVLPQP